MRGIWATLLGAGLCSVLLSAPATTRAQDVPPPPLPRPPAEPRAQEAPPPPPQKSPAEPLQQPAAPSAVVTPLPMPEEPPTYPLLWQIVAPRLSTGYTSGPGMGYSNGFTQINAFVPLFGSSYEHLVYADLRGIASDNNFHWGNNVGLGYRYYNSGRDRIFGGWASFDTRDSGFTTFTQMSGGVESMGRYLDFRSNGYVITGPQTSLTNSFFINAPMFQGVNVLAPHVIQTDCALTGLDAEAGGPLPLLDRYGVRGFAGAYAFHGQKVGGFAGAQARLEARLNNNVDFNLQVRADPIFGGTVAVGGAIRWGGVRRPYREPDRLSVFNRFADPVQRNYNVSIADHKDQFEQKLTDPNTGQPIIVIHVNNTAAPGGDGSVNSPLNTLAPAPGLAGNFGYILVDKGDGTVNGMNAGATLMTGQHLLGNSMQFPFVSNELGLSRLPVGPDGTPVITNLNGGPVVTLASNSEVGGFIITAPNGTAVFGNGINTFSVHDLIIPNAVGNAIQLANVAGTGSVLNVTESGATADGLNVTTTGSSSLTLGVSTSSFTSNTGGGISLDASGSSSLTATVNNTTLSNNGTSGIAATSSGAASLGLTLQNSTISGNGTVGVVTALNGSGTQTVTLSSNTISSGTNSGVLIGMNGSGTQSFSESNDNVSVPSTGTAIAVNQTQNGGNSSTASVSNTTVSGANAAISISQIANSSGSVSATASSNTTSGNTGGISIAQTGNSSGALSATISNNTASSNVTGISLQQTANGAGSVTTSVTGNTASNNTEDGIDITTFGGNGGQTLTVSSNTVSSNGNNGLSVFFNGTGNITGTFSSNTASGNGSNGMLFAGTGIASLTLSSNTTSNNVDAGINIVNFGTEAWTVQSNALTNDNTGGAAGAGFQATNVGSSLTMTFTSNSSAPANGVGYLFQNFNTNNFTVNFMSNGGSNNSGTTNNTSNVTVN